MNSDKKLIHRQVFTEGMNTVLAAELMKSTQYIYALNCDIVSSNEGNLGIISNIKGTVEVPVDLPEGENKTIGVVLDEESNCMYFAVWNSLSFHTWYQFDISSNTVKSILQSITDTGGTNIFNWSEDSVILHADIVRNNLLYWAVEGDHARKFNISKALDKTDTGYGTIILDDFTRAYKKTSVFPPEAEYFTNEDIFNNSVYGYLFKFSIQYIYDDGEESAFSDWSRVPIPTEENSAGYVGVPNMNNGIRVRMLTGGKLVEKIRVVMKKTDLEGGETVWVNIVVLDKGVLDIPDDSEYEYDFYNNNSYLGIDQTEVIRPQSYLPRMPKLQAFTNNTMVYGNFKIGYPKIDVDFSASVSYSDLFIPSETENQTNNPFINVVIIDTYYEDGSFLARGWRHTVAEVVIGNDVRRGNVFRMIGRASNSVKIDKTVVATANDDSRSIAAQFYSYMANHERIRIGGAWIEPVTRDSTGISRFRFDFRGETGDSYLTFQYSAQPVTFNSLKNTGNSVVNEKMGAALRYALYYEDDDGRKTLAYGNNEIVDIDTINDQGGIKQVKTSIRINHMAPSWASRYGIVRTKNLKQLTFIQVLVQSIQNVTTTSLGEEYHDLSLASLYTYQQVNPNATIRYEFKKGDRVRFVGLMTNGVQSYPSNVIDYEVLDYFPEVRHIINENVVTNGTAEVVTSVNSNYIGSSIIIGGIEREILGIRSSNDGYILNAVIGTSQTYPSYEIVNRRGVIRIKISDQYPITINPSNNIYPIVEIYTPYQSLSNSENENYYDIGYKFDIVDGYHIGNEQDQSAGVPAIINVEGLDNYVRNRPLATNTSITNPNMTLGMVEDPSFSDFYISDLSSYGRATVLDDSEGEVELGNRLVFSSNTVEGTKIVGLNMFDNLSRVDYNDKYGTISRIMYNEGRLYIFKHLKTGWIPVGSKIITDNEGQAFLAASDRLLPESMQYFLWEGGVGDNPESIVRDGNDIFGVSPNSGVIFRIGGNGVIPISKTFGIDNEARDIISSATKSNIRMFGGYNRKKDLYVLNIPEYDKIAYNDTISSSNYRTRDIPILGSWGITSPPGHGSVSINGDVATYSGNQGYSGMDYFSYRAGTGIVRNVCLNILSSDTETSWRGDGQFCVADTEGVRTGEVGWSILAEYDNINEVFTGATKPNTPSDPDYVSPIMDEGICPIQMEFIRLGVLSAEKSSQSITFGITSEDEFNVQVRVGSDYYGALIDETGDVSSGEYTLDLPIAQGEYSIYLLIPTANYDGVSEISITGAYFKSAFFGEVKNITSLILDQSSIPASHNLVFNILDISSNVNLTTLRVIHHNISSINLSTNNILQEINVSRGVSLSSLTIGSWSSLNILRVHDSLFTGTNYSTSFIDSVIASFDAATISGSGKVLQYGVNNSSGIRPSQSAISSYSSLISKGVAVTGLSPLSNTATLRLNYLDSGDGNYFAAASLSRPLDVVLTVSFLYEVRQTSAGPIIDSGGVSFVFQPGDTLKNQNIYSGFGSYVFRFTNVNVSPNPAGGIQINVNNFNP